MGLPEIKEGDSPHDPPMKRNRLESTDDRVVLSFVHETARTKGLVLTAADEKRVRDWVGHKGDLSSDPLFDTSQTFSSTRGTDASEVDKVLYRRRWRRFGWVPLHRQP